MNEYEGTAAEGIAEPGFADLGEAGVTRLEVVSTVASLTEALAKAQGEIESPRKTKTAKVKMKEGGEYSYSYADLADVIEAIRGPLSRNGIAWTQDATTHKGDPPSVSVTTVLMKGDERLDFGPFELPVLGGNAQAFGSAETYARRYAITSILGIASEVDDDGALASQAGSTRDRTPKATEAQMRRLHALAKQKGKEHADVRDWVGQNLGKESLTELTKADAKAVMDALEELPDVEQATDVPADVDPKTGEIKEPDRDAPASKETWAEAVALFEKKATVIDAYREENRIAGSVAVKDVTEGKLRELIAIKRQLDGAADESESAEDGSGY